MKSYENKIDYKFLEFVRLFVEFQESYHKAITGGNESSIAEKTV